MLTSNLPARRQSARLLPAGLQPNRHQPTRRLACVLLSMLVAATGCVVGEDPSDLSDPEAESVPDEVDPLGLASPSDPCGYDAMDAASFYAQFAYRDRGGFVPFRMGSTYDVDTQLPSGDVAHLEISMLANGRVIANYEERRGTSIHWTTSNETVIVTRATIDATTRRLTIVGVGTGTPSTRFVDGKCAPRIELTYSQNIRSPGLTGKAAAIVAIWTSAYMVDPDHLEACPYESLRQRFEEERAAGVIKIVRP